LDFQKTAWDVADIIKTTKREGADKRMPTPREGKNTE
jgi:hypothetical protein